MDSDERDDYWQSVYSAREQLFCDYLGKPPQQVMEMIDLLSKRFGYSPIDAYMLCSVCADLRISSIVDVPNWVVSFYFPRIVLE